MGRLFRSRVGTCLCSFVLGPAMFISAIFFHDTSLLSMGLIVFGVVVEFAPLIARTIQDIQNGEV
jgi:hypothetical protein